MLCILHCVFATFILVIAVLYESKHPQNYNIFIIAFILFMHILFFICTEHLSNAYWSPSLAAEQPEHGTDYSPAPHAGDVNVCSLIILFPPHAFMAWC